jgi:bacillithiol synthase
MGLTVTHALKDPEVSGDLPVKLTCLPFTDVPHTAQLFTDFISNSSKVKPFYPRNANFRGWFREENSRLQYDPARRERVADILHRQNAHWGAASKTAENIARLRAGAAAVVTGQQVGLFGGPAFSLYKALTAVKLADEATRGGVDCVPIFWLATQDHDLQEINHVSLPGTGGSLEKFTISSHDVEDAPVANVQLGAEISPLLDATVALLGESDASSFLRDSYRPGETLGTAFARLFSRLFADWGVILLDAADPELNSIAQPIYRGAMERAVELDEGLLARGKELEAAGYHQQVKITPASTLMFAIKDGARMPVRRRSNGDGKSLEFMIGKDVFSREALLRWIAESPQQFSANALLRPVVQDYLLPTLAYVGGSAEVAYFAQAGVVYEALLGQVTPIIPRFSATLVEAKPKAILEKYSIAFSDVFQGSDPLKQQLGSKILPQDLTVAFDEAEALLEKSMSRVRAAIEKLDVTLVDASSDASAKMKYQLERLRGRAARAELQRTEIVGRKAEYLSSMLYPNKALQEREIGGIYFVARYGLDLLRSLYEAIHTDCFDHQVIEL